MKQVEQLYTGFTPAERRRIDRAARMAHSTTRSGFVRQVVLQKVDDMLGPREDEPEAVATT